KQKQGGNVATYFCAPDGRVLHCVAGPVDAATLLREAKWVVENTKKAMGAAKGDGARFKAYFRKAHADKVRTETGLVVEPVTYDRPAPQEGGAALTYGAPGAQRLAPRLPPPPIDGPDVTIKAARALESADAAPAGFGLVRDRRGRGWALGTQGRADMLLAAHCMVKIEKVYGAVFEGILGERISTNAVEVVTPFPWVHKGGPKPPVLTR